MPSEYSPASTEQRARYPDIKDEFGEDPARWLDHPLFDRPSLREMARIRAYSIDDIDLARKWIEVECELDRGPRKKVVSWLNERIEALKIIGDRPDRLQERESRDVPDSEWYVIRDGERVPWEDIDRVVDVTTRVSRNRARADGGESNGE